MRGAVVCGHCNAPLTACWAKGKYSLYPYYFCPKRGCEGYAKTVRPEIIEGQFETILRRVQPSKEVFAAARAMFKTLWDRRLAADSKATQPGASVAAVRAARSQERWTGLEVAAAAQNIAVETGLEHRPVCDGQRVSGIYRRSVMLASGRFAMLDDGKDFSLVPWKPVIEQRLGKTLAATVRSGSVTWKIGRQRGPSI